MTTRSTQKIAEENELGKRKKDDREEGKKECEAPTG